MSIVLIRAYIFDGGVYNHRECKGSNFLLFFFGSRGVYSIFIRLEGMNGNNGVIQKTKEHLGGNAIKSSIMIF
jgi:hypothetical protein